MADTTFLKQTVEPFIIYGIVTEIWCISNLTGYQKTNR